MLTIRNEQMAEFEKHMLKEFRDRMALHLRSTYPDQTSAMSDEELAAFVEGGLGKAEGYDISEDDDIQRFLEHMVTRGPDFDQDDAHPTVQEILSDPEVGGHGKMDEIDLYYGLLGAG